VPNFGIRQKTGEQEKTMTYLELCQDTSVQSFRSEILRWRLWILDKVAEKNEVYDDALWEMYEVLTEAWEKGRRI